MQIVIPRSPIQAKGLLLASIRDPNPVLFMEPKILYRSAGLLCHSLTLSQTYKHTSVEQVPVDDFCLPLGKAETLIPGSDLTLLTWGTPIYSSEDAIRLLQNPPPSLDFLVPKSLRQAKVELIDLRTILPWDMQHIVDSVNRTGRLVIVHEAGMTAGAGAEISAQVQKRCFLKLEAPIRRVAGWE